MRTPRLAALTVAALIGVTACGSDDTATESNESATVDLDEIRAELDSLEFESPTIDGVSMLGNAPIDDEMEPPPVDAALVDPELVEDCPEDDECPELDEIYGAEPAVEPDALPEPPAFTPTAEWAPFCTVLAELEDRPFPTDDDEALRTVDIWFRILEPHVPTLIADAFGVLDDVIDEAVEAGDPSVLEESPYRVEQAADRIGTAVDAGCSGRGSLDDVD